MRVLLVHARYRQRGGEDQVFESELALLQKHGIATLTLELSNDSISTNSVRGTLLTGVNAIWSRGSSIQVVESAQRFRADLIHFHNTFPLLAPNTYTLCSRAGFAVVQTLHNFRLMCLNGLFFRDGRPCEDCLGRTPPYPGIVHGCYRQSRAQSAAVASMLTFHRFRGTWNTDVDRYIALNEFSRQKFIEGGIPADRVVVKSNFVELTEISGPVGERSSLLYVGRLSVEKGISTLADAWARYGDLPRIDVLGDGPLLPEVQAVAERHPSLTVRGRRSRDEVMHHMRSAYALVFPSGCYENFPVAIAEAFACGVPVIASGHGAMLEIAEEGVTGLFFRPGDANDLAEKVRWAWAHPDEMRRMGENARREYAAKYTPERNYEMLMDIYRQAIEHSKRVVQVP